MTLIHHDGQKLTTRQIISMESLREVLLKHEKVPMDDPQVNHFPNFSRQKTNKKIFF